MPFSKKLRRRFRKFRRSPKIFISTPGRQVVVPFRPLSLLLIICLLATTIFFFLRTDIFQVKTLVFEFEGASEKKLVEEGGRVPDEALVRQRISEEVLARSIVFLDSQEVEEKIKREFHTIEAIEIAKRFPDKLIIRVSARIPLARVRGREGEFLVDAEGFIFREAAGENLPVIDLGESFAGSIGEVVGGDAVKAYLEALRGFAERGLAIRTIVLKPEMLELQLTDGPMVLLSVEKCIIEQVEVLSQILKRYKIAGRTPLMVDLRFTRPVVRF